MGQDYNYKKLILLAGPPGCGKTTIARVVAKHCGYHYEEINASDDRSGKALIHKIHNLVTHQTVGRENKPTCVIIDEVDGALDSDSNGIKDVLNYLETGVVPGEIKKDKADKNDKKKDKNQKAKQPTPEVNEIQELNERKTKVDRPVIFICNDPFVRGLK
jgi:chromosome transmission fidelity protein 18